MVSSDETARAAIDRASESCIADARALMTTALGLLAFEGVVRGSSPEQTADAFAQIAKHVGDRCAAHAHEMAALRVQPLWDAGVIS